ncbi:MAG TPA: hypothetical protein VGC42_16375 [Kofleriaceae bacterium]
MRARTSMIAFAAIVPFVGVAPFVNVVSWPLFFALFGALAAMSGISWLSYRRGKQLGWVALAATLAMTLIASRLGGPFLLTPVFTCGIGLGLSSIPWLARRPWVILAWIVLATCAPVALEALGAFRVTWWYDGDSIKIQSAMLHGINRGFETAVLLLAHVTLIAMAGNVVRTTARDRRAAERKLHIQAWHLRQLLPRA